MNSATLSRAYWVAGRFYAPGLDRDDLAQEALLGALEAQRSYRTGQQTSYVSFEISVMRRRVMDAVTAARRLKRGSGQTTDELPATLANRHTTSEIVEGREALRELIVAVRTLSPTERRALVGFANGLTYLELGPKKQVDNALQRARRKLAA